MIFASFPRTIWHDCHSPPLISEVYPIGCHLQRHLAKPSTITARDWGSLWYRNSKAIYTTTEACSDIWLCGQDWLIVHRVHVNYTSALERTAGCPLPRQPDTKFPVFGSGIYINLDIYRFVINSKFLSLRLISSHLVGFTFSQATKALKESRGIALLYFRPLH